MLIDYHANVLSGKRQHHCCRGSRACHAEAAKAAVAVLKRAEGECVLENACLLSTTSRLFDFQNANVRKGDAT